MAYQSLLGYAKDGIAEVVGTSSRTMSDIDTWALDAYRNLKLYSPATGELKTWLEANAVKMPLEGTWVFNTTLSDPPGLGSDTIVWSVNFKCSLSGTSSIINSITLGLNSSTDKLQMIYTGYPEGTSSSNTTSSVVYGSTASTWVNQAYRTITFTEPVQYEGNEEFVRWFVDNAVQSGGGVSFRLNDTITLSIKPQNVTWTSDRIAKVPSYYCAPYFINNFKIGDKSYTYFGAHKDATIFKSYRQIDGSVTYDTVAGLTMYLNILPDESFYSQNTLTGQTSIVYPDYPLSVTANTSGIILVFEELPTGSFLTWLNENATLIPTTK